MVEGGIHYLNLSSLAAKWEIDLVAEDRRFGAKMEEMFEEDLDHAREIRLLRAGRYLRVWPDRQIENADRRARHGVVGSGSGAAATIPGWVARPSRRVAPRSTPTKTPSLRRPALPS